MSNVVKPLTDDRVYHHLILENQLSVLLISDQNAEKSGAAMDVRVGHFSDPENVAGLAHFCEHMLFLGTSKYPDEGSYQDFVKKHGGQTNAFTDMESTNYHFDISNEGFKEGLDRFAQFFISPLFTEDASAREMKAVHNEHSKNVQEDMWRMFQLLKSTANKQHPFSKFGTGNLKTLDDIPKQSNLNIREVLLDFHQKYYSANVMKLVVLSNQPIDTLVQWVSEMFSPIVDKNVPLPSHEYNDQSVFTRENLTKLYKIVPVREVRELILIFPVRIQNEEELYLAKQDRYLAHLLGHEGRGSIFSYLKKLGLLTALSAGQMSHFHNYVLFTVTMRMTEEGEKVWQNIVSVVFEYLKLLRQQGPQEWIHHECANLALAQFKFLEKRSASNYTSSLATSMQRYPPEKVIAASYLYYQYSPSAINNFLDQLVPENMNIYYSSKIHENEATEEEQWYGVKYLREDLDSTMVDKWKRGEHSNAEQSELELPKPNPFVSENFDIKSITEPKQFPELIRDTNRTRLWFKQDHTFKQPKVNIFYNVIVPESYSSPRVVVMSRLFALLVADVLNEVSYDAEIAGVSYDIQPSVTGFVVYLSGYNDKITELNRVVFEHVVNLAIDTQRYDVIKADLTETYRNLRKNQPYEHALTTSYEALYLNKWTYDEYIQVIDDISLQMMQHFVPQFLSCLRSETLIHGNMTESEALHAMDVTEELLFGDRPSKLFKTTSPLKSQRTEERIVKLENGIDYLVQRPEPNRENENSAIEVIYQVGLRNQKEDVSLDLLAQMISTPYYSQLRTVEQLGYLVFSRARRDNNINSMSFILQSSDKSPQFMLSRNDLFMEQFVSQLKETDDESFQEHVRGLRTMIEEKDKQLKEETIRYWKEIVHQQYLFNRAELKVQALNQLTKQDLINFFENHMVLSSANCRRLIVMYSSNKFWPPAEEELKEVPAVRREPLILPEVLGEWKEGMYFYPGHTKY